MGQLGHRRPGIRSDDGRRRQLGDHPERRGVAGGSLLGQHLRLMGEHGHQHGDSDPGRSTPTASRWRSRRTGETILARRRSPAADNYDTASEKDATPALTVSQGRLPTESGVSGDTGSPPAKSRSRLTISVTCPADPWPTRSPPARITRSAVRPEAIIIEGTTTAFHNHRFGCYSNRQIHWTASTSRSTSSTLPMTYLGLTLVAPNGAYVSR